MTTEEVKIPSSEELLSPKEEQVQQETQTAPEHSVDEQMAMSQGWVPKDQWKGNPDDWRPAKEFNERGELFTRIKTQSKELQELKQAMSFLTAQQQKQFQAGFEQAVRQLKTQRDALLEEGNVLEAQRVTDKLDEMKQQHQQVAQRAQQTGSTTPKPSEYFVNWHQSNPWYLQDKTLTRHAEVLGLQFKDENPNSTEADMLNYVTKEIRKEFSHKFSPKGAPSPDGEGRSPRGHETSTSTQYKGLENSMTEEQRGIMKTILKSTGMTKEQYFKQYAS